eukprot:49858-Prymnesium_polylepis.1
MRSVTRGDNIHGTRNPPAHQHPLPTAHTSRRRSSYCLLQLAHVRAAHVLHGDLAQPTQSFKSSWRYTGSRP